MNRRRGLRLVLQSCSPADADATLASHAADEVEERALVVVAQVGQVVREVGEVVADAGLQVLAEVTIDSTQQAAPRLTDIREIEHSLFGHAFPILVKPPV